MSELVAVYVTSGVSTSAGNGPGVFELPAAEAAALVGRKVAVYGSQPPGTATHLPAAAGPVPVPEISAGLSDHAHPVMRQHLPRPERPAGSPQAVARAARGVSN